MRGLKIMNPAKYKQTSSSSWLHTPPFSIIILYGLEICRTDIVLAKLWDKASFSTYENSCNYKVGLCLLSSFNYQVSLMTCINKPGIANPKNREWGLQWDPQKSGGMNYTDDWPLVVIVCKLIDNGMNVLKELSCLIRVGVMQPPYHDWESSLFL